MVTLIMSFACFFAYSNNVSAEVETSFLFSLSNFNGLIGYNWANIAVDEERNEIYISGASTTDVRVFNDHGMEIYRLDADDHLNSAIDLAVKEDGNIFLLSRNGLGVSVFLYKNNPCRQEQIHMLPLNLQYQGNKPSFQSIFQKPYEPMDWEKFRPGWVSFFQALYNP